MPPAPSPETILMTRTLGPHLAEEAPEEEVAVMDAAGETKEEEMAVEGAVREGKNNNGK